MTTLGIPETIVGADMTYDGHLVVLASRELYVMNRDLTGDPQVVRAGDDETISNSMAVDADGGIYFASDKVTRKAVWKDGKLSTDAADGADQPGQWGLRDRRSVPQWRPALQQHRRPVPRQDRQVATEGRMGRRRIRCRPAVFVQAQKNQPNSGSRSPTKAESKARSTAASFA